MDLPRQNSDETPTPPNLPPKSKPPKKTGDEAPPPFMGPWMLFVVIGMLILFMLFQNSPSSTGSRVPYSLFRKELKDNNVSDVQFFGEILTGTWRKPPIDPKTEKDEKPQPLKEKFNTVLPPEQVQDAELMELLTRHNVKIDPQQTNTGIGTTLLLWMIGPLMLIGFFWFMMRRTSDPMGTGFLGNFSKSPARRFLPSEQQTTYDDVAAMDQAKMELQEIIEFLKNPAKFQLLGAQIPKGVLLMGAPGTGKTLLARATAGEAGVPFFSINGSEFIQMFVGVGASRVRDLFRTAKEHAPCILFIDEIDAVGRVRGAGLGGGHDEREQTLNQILSEMDGFQQNDALIVLAATNRPDVLDPALLRPGRFDRHVTVDRAAKEGRLAILKVHCRKVPLSDNVKLDLIAGVTVGFSGAELKNLVNEAALNAVRLNKKVVEHEDFEAARDKVLMGSLREEKLTHREREMVAYHEAGHALLVWLSGNVDAVYKVTIIPRGRSLGVTQLLPEEERFNVGEKRLHAQLSYLLGGRAAEKLIFDEYSAGAEDDLRKATQLARRMVGHWGMSELIGPVAFRHSDDHPFLGKEIHEQRDFSDETARIIDEEVQKFLNKAAEHAFNTLKEKRGDLDLLAKNLLKRETLSREDITALIGEPVREAEFLPQP
ncbi:MAG: ATP-dependent zinc metalloprotease FtsH [Planctomycetaceae bacterium]